MPDWRQRVREHLEECELPPAECEQVVRELAAHLEEIQEEARSRGMSEAGAVQLALREVEDWRVLAADIWRAKTEEDGMNNRTKSLWLPGMVNLIVAAGLLMILQKLRLQPRVVWIGDMAMVLYLPWLIMLPIFGALGALLAKRAQACSLDRLLAGLAPALAILGSFAGMLPLSLAIGTAHLAGFPWIYFALTVFNWVVIPGLALMVGALPFLRGTQPGEGISALE
jgi:hypothetical protein